MTKDEAVAMMFASRATVLENESGKIVAELMDTLEWILSITQEEHCARGQDSKLYEIRTLARLAIKNAGGSV